jgi:hypothetical protein
MSKYLAIYSDQINEIEVSGFSLMSDKEIENYEDLANSITWDFTYQMGDTELNFTDGEDLLSKIEFKELTNEEFKVLNKIFSVDFGTFISEDYLTDIVAEEIDEEEYDDEDEY